MGREQKTSPNYKTADLMRLTGVGRNTLRFYEEKGLLLAPSRTTSGYRVFSEDAFKDLNFIKQAKAAGLVLTEIKEILDFARMSSTTCGKVSSKVKSKVVEVEATIEQLQTKKDFLCTFLDTCQSQEKNNSCDIRSRGFEAVACCEKPVGCSIERQE